MTGVTDPTDPEDRKIITLARAARARTQRSRRGLRARHRRSHVRRHERRPAAPAAVGRPGGRRDGGVVRSPGPGGGGRDRVPRRWPTSDRSAIGDLGGSAVVVWLTDGAGAVRDRVACDRADELQPEPAGFRSGFACFVGRPNAGKSTLTNALVGSKIAIASSKPQTTRHAIRGIVNRPDAQLVLIDTPGLHKPRTLLGERLNDLVRATWTEVDVVGVCLPANEKIGPGDTYLVGEIAALPKRPAAGRDRHQVRSGQARADGPAPAGDPGVWSRRWESPGPASCRCRRSPATSWT